MYYDMKPLKFLWSMLQLSCFALVLSGCVAGLSTPAIILPLILISVVLLFPATHLDHYLRTGLWAIDLAQTNPDFREQADEWLTHAARHIERYIDGC
jgi:hypothetical protein